MELWFTEKQVPGLALSWKISQTLHRETTPYQELLVVETDVYGRMLVLDGAVQTTERDEFVYHEMIAHVPLFAHPNPKRVAVVGGGDGGAIREILKHQQVELAELVEIDERVVEASRRFFPQISAGLDDPRARLVITDGIEHIANSKGVYDVIIVDSTDPVGPAVGLFSADFYQSVFEALKEDGIFVAQSESPFLNQDLIREIYRAVSSIFPKSALYLAAVPTYPSGLWSFTVGSKVYDPAQIADENRFKGMKSRYYSPEVHRAAFALPPFVRALLDGVKD